MEEQEENETALIRMDSPKRERDFVRDLSSLGSPHDGLVIFVSKDYFKPNDPIEKIYRGEELIIKKMRARR
jgi:hypothetical protein